MSGLVSISFRKNSVEEIVSAVKFAGLKYIEWGSDVHAPKDDIHQLEKIKKLQIENNIICSSYGTYFRIGETDISELQSYIDAAKILGTNILRLWCGNKNYEEYTDEERNKLIGICKRCALIAEQNNVFLCMECHNKTYTNSLNGAKELMKKVNSKNFLMYWQPNQFRTFEENIEYAKEISPYTKIIHVFNWQGADRYPLKDAVDVWKAYLKCFQKNVICLLEFMPDDNILSLSAEADALQNIKN